MSLLDNLDIAVLAFIADHPDSSVTDCAKTLFSPENTEQLQKKDSLLRHRFKALTSAGFLDHTSSSGRKIYKVVDKKVSFGPELRGVNIGGKNFFHPDLRKDYCIILFTDDGVIVRSLDKIEENWKSG